MIKYPTKAHLWSDARKRAYSLKWRGENSSSWKGGLTNNQEYQRIQRKKWYKNNIDRLKILWKESHLRRREEQKILKKIWRKSNKEKVASINKKWRDSHPEQVRLLKILYREQNREKVYFNNKQRYLRERNVIGMHTLQEWEDLKVKCNNQCMCCKKKEPEIKLTEDHIQPLIKDGQNGIENIQPLCQVCNSSKGVKIINYLSLYETQKEVA